MESLNEASIFTQDVLNVQLGTFVLRHLNTTSSILVLLTTIVEELLTILNPVLMALLIEELELSVNTNVRQFLKAITLIRKESL